jgi:hypothetical protein
MNRAPLPRSINGLIRVLYELSYIDILPIPRSLHNLMSANYRGAIAIISRPDKLAIVRIDASPKPSVSSTERQTNSISKRC